LWQQGPNERKGDERKGNVISAASLSQKKKKTFHSSFAISRKRKRGGEKESSPERISAFRDKRKKAGRGGREDFSLNSRHRRIPV